MILKNKKILVTGADGFIGSHLTEMLVKEGCNVKALSQYNSFNYWGWLEDIDCIKEVEVLNGDIRDPHYIKKITKNVEVIFHLASLIAIPYSYIAPDSYVDTNIKGTLNICQAGLENGVEKIIHTSTSEVYGTAKYVPIDELHPLQPQSPYSASKISADAMAESFYRAFNLPITIARPFNTYGPRQSARAVIPTIITQILNNHQSLKLGDVSPTRDFNYVEDTCLGFKMIALSDKVIGETINIGSNSEIAIGDVAKLIKKITNSSVDLVFDEQRIRPEKSEVNRLWCDNRKIEKLCNFKPTYNIEQGLTKTIEWFKKKENLLKYKADIYNV
jgi:NAD dependent epimerase/dehydratase